MKRWQKCIRETDEDKYGQLQFACAANLLDVEASNMRSRLFSMYYSNSGCIRMFRPPKFLSVIAYQVLAP